MICRQDADGTFEDNWVCLFNFMVAKVFACDGSAVVTRRVASPDGTPRRRKSLVFMKTTFY
jgi:hypothetical protein